MEATAAAHGYPDVTREAGPPRLRPETVAFAQAAWYVPPAIWPLVHMGSFERVTGPKPEGWLVRTVALLLLAIGGALGLAARRGRVTPELRVLGSGSAAALAAIDVWYALRGRISPVYLLDAAGEAALIAAWARTGSTSEGGTR